MSADDLLAGRKIPDLSHGDARRGLAARPCLTPDVQHVPHVASRGQWTFCTRCGTGITIVRGSEVAA